MIQFVIRFLVVVFASSGPGMPFRFVVCHRVFRVPCMPGSGSFYTKSYIPEVIMHTLLNRNNPIGCMCSICDKAWLIIERERERERETDIVSERNLGMCCEAFECCMYIKLHIEITVIYRLQILYILQLQPYENDAQIIRSERSFPRSERRNSYRGKLRANRRMCVGLFSYGLGLSFRSRVPVFAWCYTCVNLPYYS